MGHHLGREVAMSQRNKNLETVGIPDPCGPEYDYQRIVAIYIKYVMCGINYYNKDVLRSKTVRG
jgi:hypothetical protein